MRITYEPKRFNDDHTEIIRNANAICAQYAAQGFDLTLRQLYYQFVSRDLLPNTQQSYNKLGSVINAARMAGALDWDYIVDRGRNLASLSHWDDPGGVIRSAAASYHRDLWADQALRVEVWIEKDALSGVIAPTCNNLDIAYFACKGYTSQSEMWAAGRRISRYIENGQRVVILHLGDHDPSGIDMTRDIAERLDTFTTQDYLNAHSHDFPGDTVSTLAIRVAMSEHVGLDRDGYSGLPPVMDDRGALVVKRIALTMDQVTQYDPPPNPAKMTDSRFDGYLAEFGDESWELDALEPAVLAALIADEVDELVDRDLLDAAMERERTEVELVREAASRWPEIVELLQPSTNGQE